MWAPLREGQLRNLAVGRNEDGRLEVFGTAHDDSIWHVWQTSPNGGCSARPREHAGRVDSEAAHEALLSATESVRPEIERAVIL